MYNVNGTGRDTYIYVNSGGFTINNEATTYPPVGKHILDF
jgi:hypothetical protein